MLQLRTMYLELASTLEPERHSGSSLVHTTTIIYLVCENLQEECSFDGEMHTVYHLQQDKADIIFTVIDFMDRKSQRCRDELDRTEKKEPTVTLNRSTNNYVSLKEEACFPEHDLEDNKVLIMEHILYSHRE